MEDEGGRGRQMRVAQHAGNDAKESCPLDLFNSDHLEGACIICLTDCLCGKGFIVLTSLFFVHQSRAK